VKPFGPRRARDLAIVAAVVALAGAALADTVRNGASEGAGGEPDVTAPLTMTNDVPRLVLPAVRVPGRIALTEAVGCGLRVVDTITGRESSVPRVATSCEVWAPRIGGRVAYGVDRPGGAETRFRVLDLANPRARSGEMEMTFGPMAWSPDGRALAWCDTATSGFELTLGGEPERLDHCPRAYDSGGVTAYALDRAIFVDGHRLLTVGGHADQLAWGIDGSLAVVVNRERVERYEGERLVRVAALPPEAQGRPLTFSPDNCAALVLETALVRLIDLGCFRGRGGFTTLSVDNCTNRPDDVTLRCARYPAPRTFEGGDAAWSPDGEWIAVAEPEAVVFHRVVGRYAAVRWPVAAARVAWTLG
jgi:WD40-like Beta Propeller Repeat